MSACPAFWLQDPSILWTQPTEFFPFTEHDKRCTASALNSFTRFGLYVGVVLALVRLELVWLLVGVFFGAFAVGAWFYMSSTGAVREGFDVLTDAPIVEPRDVIGQYVPDVIGSSDRTVPTGANPFMNVLLTEISDNPYRKPAANIDSMSIRTELDTYFQTMFASDPGDVFGKTQSQRMFYTTPSSTIPNDQSAFADWLYRVPGQTYKEGNLQALSQVPAGGGGGETIPWLSLQAN